MTASLQTVSFLRCWHQCYDVCGVLNQCFYVTNFKTHFIKLTAIFKQILITEISPSTALSTVWLTNSFKTTPLLKNCKSSRTIALIPDNLSSSRYVHSQNVEICEECRCPCLVFNCLVSQDESLYWNTYALCCFGRNGN